MLEVKDTAWRGRAGPDRKGCYQTERVARWMTQRVLSRWGELSAERKGLGQKVNLDAISNRTSNASINLMT